MKTRRITIIVLVAIFSLLMLYFNLEDTGKLQKKETGEDSKITTSLSVMGDKIDAKFSDVSERFGVDVIDLKDYDLSQCMIAVVIPPKEFRDEEYIGLLNLLKKVNAKVVIVSTTKEEVIGMLGKEKALPEMLVSELNPAEFDGLVILGGTGTKNHLWRNKELEQIVFEFSRYSKPIGAIQLAPVILANSGIVHGRRMTVYKSFETLKFLQSGGVNFLDRGLVIDGNIVTANGPKMIELFSKTFIVMISEYMDRKKMEKERNE